MKKVIKACLLHSFVLFFSRTDGIFTTTKPIKNDPVCMNTQSNFGRTHFIVGYDKPIHPSSKKNVDPSKQAVKNNNPQKSLLDENCTTQAFFTSKHNIREVIAELIGKATHSIRIAAFALTDPEIATRIQKAAESGITIEIITDFANMNEPYSKIKNLVSCNIPAWHYSSALNTNPKQKNSRYARMHHKFMIFDDNCVINGSANYTKSGQKDNIENIVVIRDQHTVNRFIKEFNRLKTQCIACQQPIKI